MRNPVAGLMIGVVGTVMLQSSSTSTAIVVTLVASKCKSGLKGGLISLLFPSF